jgi:hypothetical protein
VNLQKRLGITPPPAWVQEQEEKILLVAEEEELLLNKEELTLGLNLEMPRVEEEYENAGVTTASPISRQDSWTHFTLMSCSARVRVCLSVLHSNVPYLQPMQIGAYTDC